MYVDSNKQQASIAQAALGAAELWPQNDSCDDNAAASGQPDTVATDVPLSSDDVDDLLSNWASQVSCTLSGLQSASDARNVFKLCHDNQLALAEHSDKQGRRLSYISLDKKYESHLCLGRVARLDKDNRVIYNIPGFVPCTSFASAVVVHPCVGVRMQKETTKGTYSSAAVMPANIIALKRCFELCWSAEDSMMSDLLSANLFSADARPSCVKCNRPCDELECPLCGWAWHSLCAISVIHKLPSFKPSIPDQLNIPDAFPTAIATLLSARLQALSSSSVSSACAPASMELPGP